MRTLLIFFASAMLCCGQAFTFNDLPFMANTPGAAAFAPTNIADLVYAFEADQLSAQPDGTSITSHRDAWTAVLMNSVGTAQTKETYNGLPVLRFNGTGNYVTTNSLLTTNNATNLTFIVVQRVTSNTSTYFAGAVNSGALSFGPEASPAKTIRFGLGFLTPATQYMLDSGNGAVFTARYDGGTVTRRVNYGTNANTSATGSANLTGVFTLGASSANGSRYVGDMRAFYIYKRCLNDTELNQLTAYCITKNYGFVGLGNIVAEGDSLTQGLGGTHSWTTNLLNKLFTNAVYYNYLYNVSQSGETLSQMNTQFVGQVAPKLFSAGKLTTNDVVVLWAGTNDLLAGDPAATVIQNFTNYSAMVRSNGAKLFFINTISRGGFVGATEQARLDYNNFTRTNSVWWDKYYDAAARFTNSADVTIYNADAVHLIDAGYTIISEAVYSAMVPW